MATNTWDIPTMQPAPGMLGRDFKTFGFKSDWNGSGADSTSAAIAGRVLADKALMQKLGLTEADIQFKAGGYQNDNVIDDQFTLSDKARQALAGLTMSRTGVAGKKDGRSQVLRDAQGNVLSAGQAYTHDPAGDLKDAALKAAAVMAAAYGAGSMLGGSAAPGAATGATAGAEGAALSGLDAAALDAGAGAVAGGAEAAGAAGAVAGDSAVKAALFGGPGYGAGMTGAATSAFDTVLGLTGSTSLASAAGSVVNGGSWLSTAFEGLVGTPAGNLFSGSSVLRDILPLIGAGVERMNYEKAKADDRAWLERRDADARRRRMPTTGRGMLPNFRVIPGSGG